MVPDGARDLVRNRDYDEKAPGPKAGGFGGRLGFCLLAGLGSRLGIGRLGGLRLTERLGLGFVQADLRQTLRGEVHGAHRIGASRLEVLADDLADLATLGLVVPDRIELRVEQDHLADVEGGEQLHQLGHEFGLAASGSLADLVSGEDLCHGSGPFCTVGLSQPARVNLVLWPDHCKSMQCDMCHTTWAKQEPNQPPNLRQHWVPNRHPDLAGTLALHFAPKCPRILAPNLVPDLVRDWLANEDYESESGGPNGPPLCLPTWLLLARLGGLRLGGLRLTERLRLGFVEADLGESLGGEVDRAHGVGPGVLPVLPHDLRHLAPLHLVIAHGRELGVEQDHLTRLQRGEQRHQIGVQLGLATTGGLPDVLRREDLSQSYLSRPGRSRPRKSNYYLGPGVSNPLGVTCVTPLGQSGGPVQQPNRRPRWCQHCVPDQLPNRSRS